MSQSVPSNQEARFVADFTTELKERAEHSGCTFQTPERPSTRLEKMRAAVCATLLLLSLCQGEALKCNFCFSKGTDLCPPSRTQTCTGSANACAAVIIGAPLRQSFRSCMNMVVCEGYVKTPGVFANCCNTDLCN